MYYEIFICGKYYTTVYDTQDIIKVACNIVNGLCYEPDDITVVEKRRPQCTR